jgi:hypothetical protein
MTSASSSDRNGRIVMEPPMEQPRQRRPDGFRAEQAAESATTTSGAPNASSELPRTRQSLGSREHLRKVLARVRIAIDTSKDQIERGERLSARAQELHDAARRTLAASETLRAELRASVIAFVRAQHQDGAPPERVLVLVKAMVSAELAVPLRVSESDSLMDDVVHWTLDAYFDAA